MTGPKPFDSHQEGVRTGDFRINLRGCARCHGEGHENLWFHRLTHPVEIAPDTAFTHWAPCPTNGEPIMLVVSPDD
jgi:hypothetical protein